MNNVLKTPSGQFQNITINTIKTISDSENDEMAWEMFHTMLVHDLFGQVGKNSEDPHNFSLKNENPPIPEITKKITDLRNFCPNSQIGILCGIMCQLAE